MLLYPKLRQNSRAMLPTNAVQPEVAVGAKSRAGVCVNIAHYYSWELQRDSGAE